MEGIDLVCDICGSSGGVYLLRPCANASICGSARHFYCFSNSSVLKLGFELDVVDNTTYLCNVCQEHSVWITCTSAPGVPAAALSLAHPRMMQAASHARPREGLGQGGMQQGAQPSQAEVASNHGGETHDGASSSSEDDMPLRTKAERMRGTTGASKSILPTQLMQSPFGLQPPERLAVAQGTGRGAASGAPSEQLVAKGQGGITMAGAGDARVDVPPSKRLKLTNSAPLYNLDHHPKPLELRPASSLPHLASKWPMGSSSSTKLASHAAASLKAPKAVPPTSTAGAHRLAGGSEVLKARSVGSAKLSPGELPHARNTKGAGSKRAKKPSAPASGYDELDVFDDLGDRSQSDALARRPQSPSGHEMQLEAANKPKKPTAVTGKSAMNVSIQAGICSKQLSSQLGTQLSGSIPSPSTKPGQAQISLLAAAAKPAGGSTLVGTCPAVGRQQQSAIFAGLCSRPVPAGRGVGRSGYQSHGRGAGIASTMLPRGVGMGTGRGCFGPASDLPLHVLMGRNQANAVQAHAPAPQPVAAPSCSKSPALWNGSIMLPQRQLWSEARGAHNSVCTLRAIAKHPHQALRVALQDLLPAAQDKQVPTALVQLKELPESLQAVAEGYRVGAFPQDDTCVLFESLYDYNLSGTEYNRFLRWLREQPDYALRVQLLRVNAKKLRITDRNLLSVQGRYNPEVPISEDAIDDKPWDVEDLTGNNLCLYLIPSPFLEGEDQAPSKRLLCISASRAHVHEMTQPSKPNNFTTVSARSLSCKRLLRGVSAEVDKTTGLPQPCDMHVSLYTKGYGKRLMWAKDQDDMDVAHTAAHARVDDKMKEEKLAERKALQEAKESNKDIDGEEDEETKQEAHEDAHNGAGPALMDVTSNEQSSNSDMDIKTTPSNGEQLKSPAVEHAGPSLPLLLADTGTNISEVDVQGTTAISMLDDGNINGFKAPAIPTQLQAHPTLSGSVSLSPQTNGDTRSLQLHPGGDARRMTAQGIVPGLPGHMLQHSQGGADMSLMRHALVLESKASASTSKGDEANDPVEMACKTNTLVPSWSLAADSKLGHSWRDLALAQTAIIQRSPQTKPAANLIIGGLSVEGSSSMSPRSLPAHYSPASKVHDVPAVQALGCTSLDIAHVMANSSASSNVELAASTGGVGHMVLSLFPALASYKGLRLSELRVVWLGSSVKDYEAMKQLKKQSAVTIQPLALEDLRGGLPHVLAQCHVLALGLNITALELARRGVVLKPILLLPVHVVDGELFALAAVKAIEATHGSCQATERVHLGDILRIMCDAKSLGIDTSSTLSAQACLPWGGGVALISEPSALGSSPAQLRSLLQLLQRGQQLYKGKWQLLLRQEHLESLTSCIAPTCPSSTIPTGTHTLSAVVQHGLASGCISILNSSEVSSGSKHAHVPQVLRDATKVSEVTRIADYRLYLCAYSQGASAETVRLGANRKAAFAGSLPLVVEFLKQLLKGS